MFSSVGFFCAALNHFKSQIWFKYFISLKKHKTSFFVFLWSKAAEIKSVIMFLTVNRNVLLLPAGVYWGDLLFFCTFSAHIYSFCAFSTIHVSKRSAPSGHWFILRYLAFFCHFLFSLKINGAVIKSFKIVNSHFVLVLLFLLLWANFNLLQLLFFFLIWAFFCFFNLLFCSF